MDKKKQTESDVDKLYRLRFWHMDASCLNTFHEKMKSIFNDCAKYNIDVEHSYYKNLHTEKVVEVDKIGVCGNIAPTGEYIDE